MVITLSFPEHAPELVTFTASPLAEAAHSWHVLTDPGHHALHLHWVRQYRAMAAPVRRGLRLFAFAVQRFVPAFLEAPGGSLYESFDEQLARFLAVKTDLVAAELAQKLIDPRWLGIQILASEKARVAARAELAGRDPNAAALLDDVLDHPARYIQEIANVLDAYWRAGFAEEWDRLEPLLHLEIAEAGRRLAQYDVLSMMRGLVPSVRVDRGRRAISLDIPHEHDVSIADRGGITLAPSHYAWPHVRIICDRPWPLQLTYPTAPLGPRPWRRPNAEELVVPLRALAAEVRLQLVALISEMPRSTHELSGLIGLSPATISRHLALLRDAGILTTERDGYYVLYKLAPLRLHELGSTLMTFGSDDAVADLAERLQQKKSRPQTAAAAACVRVAGGGR
jgi:DNA-binding transcriptional ArsR family regulator